MANRQSELKRAGPLPRKLSDAQVAAVIKTVDRELAKKAQDAASGWVGTVGERIIIDATVTRGAFTSADAARTADVLRQFAWGVEAPVRDIGQTCDVTRLHHRLETIRPEWSG